MHRSARALAWLLAVVAAAHRCSPRLLLASPRPLGARPLARTAVARGAARAADDPTADDPTADEADPTLPSLASLLSSWDNRTSARAADALDEMLRSSSRRLASLSSGRPVEPPPPPPPRSAVSASYAPRSAAAAAAEDSEAAALLEARRRRRAGELEGEHASAIASCMKMARLWPSAERQLAELLTIEPYMSASSALGRSYHAQLADAYEALGLRERARSTRRAAGLAPSRGEEPAAGIGEEPPGGSPEMAKLFDMEELPGAGDGW